MSKHKSHYNKEEDRTITFPLWKMMYEEREEEPEEEERNEIFNCLTSRVRSCYLRNLEKVLLNNYELCSEEERSTFPFSREHIVKAAEKLECKALRSCMVVILYQRAMMRLTTDIKKHTQQLKLYRRLQEFINSNSDWQDKGVQTTTQECTLVDGITQTDAIETPVIKSEPPEHVEESVLEPVCPEAQPIPVLVSGIAISKPLPEPSVQQHNAFQSTSSLQITNHNKENLIPPKTEKDKAYFKRNTKDLASREPKVISPPKRPCLRLKSVSRLQKPISANGAIPPLPTVPLSKIMDDNTSKVNIGADKPKINANELAEAVPDIPLPPFPPPAVQMPHETATEKTVETKFSVVLNQSSDTLYCSAPFLTNFNINHPSTSSSSDAPQDQAEEDASSSPRMSIEERLALVFNIPTNTPQKTSPSHRQGRGASKGSSQRRMSIEERLEAVFRGETINDEDVQSADEEDNNSAEKGNESLETVICETVPEKLVAPAHVKLRFIELFGHESDGEEEDNEPPYKDKIARWVVECLMPYYRHRLIASRPLFKRLARHIADTVMISKPLPDKSDVDDCVTEFFSRHSCVASVRDIY